MSITTPTALDNSSQEKKWLLQICAGCIIGLVILGVLAITHGVDATGATILGVIVGALATFGKDIVAAVRSYSMAASLARVTDQVANAGPPVGSAPPPPPAATLDDGSPAPIPVTVTNTAAEAVPVASAPVAAAPSAPPAPTRQPATPTFTPPPAP